MLEDQTGLNYSVLQCFVFFYLLCASVEWETGPKHYNHPSRLYRLNLVNQEELPTEMYFQNHWTKVFPSPPLCPLYIISSLFIQSNSQHTVVWSFWWRVWIDTDLIGELMTSLNGNTMTICLLGLSVQVNYSAMEMQSVLRLGPEHQANSSLFWEVETVWNAHQHTHGSSQGQTSIPPPPLSLFI